MKTSDFLFDLPESQIAQTPIEPRDHSRLMCVNRATGAIAHEHFYDVIDHLRPNDALVINDYRLLPQYRGHRFGGALMGQAVQYARKNGREKLRLTCGGDLAGYFAQFGFVETERRGTDRVMELDIRMIIREIPEA